jgi:hypothetical protein
MEKKILSVYTMVFFMMVCVPLPAVYSAEGMGSFDLDMAISTTPFHEWMPSVTYNPMDNEFLVLWHTTGIREEGGENRYSLHARRISADGTLLGEPITLLDDSSPGRKILPKAAHNSFTNQYMVTFCMQQEASGWDPFVMIIKNDGTVLSPPINISEQPTNANHPSIVFNSQRKQYLVAYNDSRNGEHDVFGAILDDQGTVVREDFAICTAAGEQQNPFICYNSKDDTYLLNWEDFRHVNTWTEPGDIYGALLDGEGNALVDAIAMVDDYGMQDEGGQWLNNIAYNPDRNEFLVSWMDTRPSMEDVGIVGRIIRRDGNPAGPDFVIADDAPGVQFWHQIVYLPGRRAYFAVWQDGRNDEPGAELLQPVNADIYAGWLNFAGKPQGSDVPICVAERNQQYAVTAYSPLADRLLIAWRDELEEEVPGGGGSGHVTETGGNVMGKMYGVPSFLTGRVVDKKTGAPVENARVLIIGPSFPEIRKTNAGGWWNIAKNSQRNGKYIILVAKRNYYVVMDSVDYAGEPLTKTIEINTW